MYGVIWFRDDLRIRDNMALHFAMRECTGVVGVYIIDRAFFKKHAVADCRVEFILRGLTRLSDDLSSLNVPLLIVEIDHTGLTGSTIAQVARDIDAKALYFNRQYEIDEKRRDLAVQKYLEAAKISCYSYDDQVILSPGSVQNQQGNFFKVFTPYRREWYRVFSQAMPVRLLPNPKPQSVLPVKATIVPEKITGYQSKIDPGLWPAGEKAARQRLKNLLKIIYWRMLNNVISPLYPALANYLLIWPQG